MTESDILLLGGLVLNYGGLEEGAIDTSKG